MRRISLTCRPVLRGLAASSSALACLVLWSSLSGCRSDEYDFAGASQGVPAGSVRFASGDPATRTTMDAGGRFYWLPGDSIWVFDGTRWVQNYASSITAKATGAEFYFHDGDSRDAVFTDSLYSVRYTGAGATRKDEVTILDQQVQSEPDNSEHFGTSGDCATATATLRSPKNYEFTLFHRASYLVFEPRIVRDTTATVRLTSIKVEKALSLPDTLCGRYSFGEDGLGRGQALNAKPRVELTCGGGFELADTFAVEKNRSFMVIQPGQHMLKITYTFETDGVEKTAVGTLPSRPYNENMFVTIRHRLDWDGSVKDDDPYDNIDPDDPPTNVYVTDGIWYMWDAVDWYGSGQATVGPRDDFGGSPVFWNLDSDGGPRLFPTRVTPAAAASDARYLNTSETGPAANSCATMPNANEMYWYVRNGNPHIYNTFQWINGVPTFSGGLYIRKRETILSGNFPETAISPFYRMERCGHESHGAAGPYFCSAHSPWKGSDGTVIYGDARVDPRFGNIERDVLDGRDQFGQIAADIDRSGYFLLPLSGTWSGGEYITRAYYDETFSGDDSGGYTVHGCGWWSSTPTVHAGGHLGAFAMFYSATGSMFVSENSGITPFKKLTVTSNIFSTSRHLGLIAGTRFDGTPWFQ